MIYFPKPGKKIKTSKELRPITLINGRSKISEALFAIRIQNKLNEINYFSKTQFGFTKGKSPSEAIKKVIDNIKLTKKINYAALFMFDASAAFDTISWEIIIKNLEKTKINSSYIKMTQDLLTNRRIILNDKTYYSETGCPQGGRANPLLWRIGMNSILKKIEENNIKVLSFADDLCTIIDDKKKSI